MGAQNGVSLTRHTLLKNIDIIFINPKLKLFGETMINEDAVVGLAIGTACLCFGFDEHTCPQEYEKRGVWDEISTIAIEHLRRVGVDTRSRNIDKYEICAWLWQMTPEEVDESISRD